MSNVIRFLEAMGGNPGVHGLSAAAYAAYAASVALLGVQDEDEPPCKK